MLKTINKFSKLAVLFTGLYILIGVFISSDMYSLEFSMKWIPRVSIANLSVVGLSYLGCMIASVIFGIKSIIENYKTEEKWKWVMFLLTFFNILSLGYIMFGFILPRIF